MARKKYDVVIAGIATTIWVNDDDAKRRGLLAQEDQPPPPAPVRKARKAVANKKVTARNKGA